MALLVAGAILLVSGLVALGAGMTVTACILIPLGLLSCVVGGVIYKIEDDGSTEPRRTPSPFAPSRRRTEQPPEPQTKKQTVGQPAEWRKFAVMETETSGVFAVDRPNRRDMPTFDRKQIEAFYREAQPGRPIEVFYEATVNSRTGWQDDILMLRDAQYGSIGYIPKDVYYALKRDFRRNAGVKYGARVEMVVPQTRGLPIILVRIWPVMG